MFSRAAKAEVRDGEQVFLTEARGYEVLRDPALNKGSAFDRQEREALGLDGLIPPAEPTPLAAQVEKAYALYESHRSDLEKHVYMWSLHDTNVTLFYAVMQAHLLEMLPVVYDPTVGEAIERYSELYTRPRGVYLSIDDIDGIEAQLENFGAEAEDIDLIVASDAEEILGIGDWGSNGIDISIGKLAVYTAAAGIDPHRVIPVVLDAGTNNERLLNDPVYIGNRHARVRGSKYDEFIDAYVAAARKLFPQALLHWEDFGQTNARRILDRHRDSVPTFNDDMQGTGAIAMSGLFNAVRASGKSWKEQKIVVCGAGTAGCGIADQICAQMVRSGLGEDDARDRIFLVDLPGLLTDDMSDGLIDYQVPYAKPAASVADWARSIPEQDASKSTRWPEMAALRDARRDAGIIDLDAVVDQVKPTILIGTSTTPRRFTETIVKSMAAATDRPIIFPLSNPTPLAEATPSQLLEWTDGRALIATGSPFDDVTFGGVNYRIGQANNAALYPGLGLGAIVCRARKVTDEMILAAALAVAGEARITDPGSALLPSNADLRATSSVVAIAVAKAATEGGVAGLDLDDPTEAVRSLAWWPSYRRVIAV